MQYSRLPHKGQRVTVSMWGQSLDGTVTRLWPWGKKGEITHVTVKVIGENRHANPGELLLCPIPNVKVKRRRRLRNQAPKPR